MKYYSAYQDASMEARFLYYENGYYYFKTINNEEVIFEQINSAVFEKFNLKSSEYNNKFFTVFYTEIMEDIDDEDFIILRLDDLNLIR